MSDYELFQGNPDQHGLIFTFHTIQSVLEQAFNSNSSPQLGYHATRLNPASLDNHIYVGYEFGAHMHRKKIMRGFCYENDIVLASEILIQQDTDERTWRRKMFEHAPMIPEMGRNEFLDVRKRESKFTNDDSATIYLNVDFDIMHEPLIAGFRQEHQDFSYFLLGQSRDLSVGAQKRQREYLKKK